MTHVDPGYHNWVDTEGFEEGYLQFRNVLSRIVPHIDTKLLKVADIAVYLPKDSRRVSAEETCSATAPALQRHTAQVQNLESGGVRHDLALSKSHVLGVTPCSRSWNFRTRPEAFLGSSSRNSMYRGSANFGMRGRAQSNRSDSFKEAPSRSTTVAFTSSSRTSEGTACMAASAMSGCWQKVVSTSKLEIFSRGGESRPCFDRRKRNCHARRPGHCPPCDARDSWKSSWWLRGCSNSR